MENTIQNREKFFALYWGQEINDYRLGKFSNKKNQKVNGSAYGYLNLTPLSLISDEDAIFIAVTAGWNSGVHRRSTLIKEGRLIAIEGLHSTIDDIGFYEFIIITDYLRSKGYALPWNGISVQQQIEYGWVKLKTE